MQNLYAPLEPWPTADNERPVRRMVDEGPRWSMRVVREGTADWDDYTEWLELGGHINWRQRHPDERAELSAFEFVVETREYYLAEMAEREAIDRRRALWRNNLPQHPETPDNVLAYFIWTIVESGNQPGAVQSLLGTPKSTLRRLMQSWTVRKLLPFDARRKHQ